jgi:hypothetical protein
MLHKKMMGVLIHYKRYLVIAGIVLALIFPKYVFGGIGIFLLVLVIILFIVDVVLDVYLIVIFMIQHYKDKR